MVCSTLRTGLATVYDRIYMTAYLVISLPKTPYEYNVYRYMVLANPSYVRQGCKSLT
jgi:hypothetical protein